MDEAATQSRPPLALIANDQEWSARSFESILATAGYAILRAYTGTQALERALSARPDVILLDDRLPDVSGLEVCRALREDARIGSTTPILITSSEPSTRRRRLEAFKAGAWQFLRAPLDAEELLLRLDVYVKAKLEADRGREEGLLDEASGLYNARGILRLIRGLGCDACRHGRALACVVFGPEPREVEPAVVPGTASATLVRVFKELGRDSDTIGRLADREFVVIAPGTGQAGARRLAERFIEAARGRQPPVEGALESVSLRAGCYAVGDLREASIQPVDLLVRATMALRRAQAAPREAPIRFYDGNGDAPARKAD